MQPTGRLYLCATCREQIFICRRCDRGNRYCRDCAQPARSASLREAGRRYQNSRRGRFAHAERARRYRARRQEEVTHHGSLAAGSNDVLQAVDPDGAVALSDAAANAAPCPAHCHFCSRPLPIFVRTGFVRRRGPHRRFHRFDRGGLADDDYP